ncbi:MAG: hypothetical protein ACP5MW_02585, partial [Thermoplasmata archaeon]
IAAYTTNGTAIYRNSTITIYNNTNTTFFSVNVTATPGVIYTKALVNPTVITKVEYYNGTGAHAFVQLRLSNTTVGHFTNQSGYTTNGIYSSQLVITQPSTKPVQIYAIANISRTYESNTTTIFFTNGSTKAFVVSISPINMTLTSGNEGNVTISVSSNNQPVRNATISIENLNSTLGYVTYARETGLDGNVTITYHSNMSTETSVDTLVITVSKAGYYNYTGVYSIAVMPVSIGMHYLSLSYTYINEETISGGQINLTIEVKDALTDIPMAGANITIILEYANGTKAYVMNGTSNVYGYYNRSMKVPVVKSNQTMYAIVKASKGGYVNQIYRVYSIKVVMPAYVKESIPTTSNTVTEGSMWWIVIVLAVILGIISMMYMNARIGKVPKAEVSEPIIRSENEPVHNKPRIIGETTTSTLPKVIKETKAPEIRAEKEKDEEFDDWVYKQPTLMEIDEPMAVVSAVRESVESEGIDEDTYAKMMVSWEKGEELPDVYDQPSIRSGEIESMPAWAGDNATGISIEEVTQIEKARENPIELPEKETAIEVKKEEPGNIVSIGNEEKGIKGVTTEHKEEVSEPEIPKDEKPKAKKGRDISQGKQKT